MSEPQAKKLKVDEIPDHLTAMDDEMKRSLVNVDNIQSDLDKVNEEAAEEILKIEQKYNKQRQPLYQKRNEQIRQISGFWHTAFLNHPQLSASIPDCEEGFISSLLEIEVEEAEDIKSGYKIILTFGKNDWLENEKVEKTYSLTDKPSTVTSPLKWVDGKKPGPYNVNEGLPPTFSEWVNENLPPDTDEIAEVIKDDLFPNPLQYYLMPDLAEDDVDYDKFLENDVEDEEEGLDEIDEAAGSEDDEKAE